MAKIYIFNTKLNFKLLKKPVKLEWKNQTHCFQGFFYQKFDNMYCNLNFLVPKIGVENVDCILGALMDFMCRPNNFLGQLPVTTVLATEWDLLLWKMDKELTLLTTWSDLWNTSGLEDKSTTGQGLSAGPMVPHPPPIGPTLEGK